MVSFKNILALAAAAVSANAAVNQLQTFTGQLASNPTNVKFYYYKPNSLKSNPGLLFAIHYCGGNGPGYFQQTQFANLADQYGFYVVYGTAPDSSGCWDVHSTASLTHNGGGDSIAFASVIKYATANWGVDSNRVFATGESSGAMMTNVLMGAYPDLFKGGSAFSGVPYGCFAGSGFWNSQCAQGQLIKTAQQWGDQVRSGYPGFTGDRPKMQVWHGTVDTTLYPQNFWEEIKEWTNVFGYSQTPISNVTNSPIAKYSTATYGPKFQAILAQGVGHSVPPRASDAIHWFGLDGSATTTTAPTSTSGTTTTTPTTTPPSGGGSCSALYGQCGGDGYTGPTCCSSGTCKFSNQWYSQCL